MTLTLLPDREQHEIDQHKYAEHNGGSMLSCKPQRTYAKQEQDDFNHQAQRISQSMIRFGGDPHSPDDCRSQRRANTRCPTENAAVPLKTSVPQRCQQPQFQQKS